MQDENKTGDARRAGKPNGKYALLFVVAGAVLFSVVQRLMLDFRAGHMDEYDYLFVGKALLNNVEWPTYTYIFGANFSWYAFGFADQLFGGLTGARMVSAGLGLVSLAGIFAVTKAVWGCHKTAWVAVLLLALQSSHIFISKIATYDSVSFALFALSLAPLYVASENRQLSRKSLLLMCAGSLLLLAAVLAKYTTVAYVPFIGLALLFRSVRATLVYTLILSIGITLFVAMHWVDLKVLYDIQISGIHGANATYREIVSRSLNGSWLLLLPAVAAVLHARSNKAANARPLHTLLWLLLLASPLVLYHLQGRNLISLYKHLNYTNAFLSIASAWLVMLVIETKPWQSSRIFQYRSHILATLTVVYVSVNAWQLRDTENGYPDMQGLLSHLAQNQQAADSILSEDPYLFRYLKFGEMSQETIKETTWLDNDADGVHTLQDVNDAAWDRKFEYILLTDAIHPEHNKTLRDILTQRGYDLEYSHPYRLSPVMTAHTIGEISLYKRGEQMATIEQ
jgi:hypothetical protein